MTYTAGSMDIHHGMDPWKSAEGSATTTKFGHADYHAAKAQGKSDAEIASWAKSNTDLMGNKGVGGDLWNMIMAAENSAQSSGGGGYGGGGGGYGGGGGGGGGYTAPTHDQELSYEGYNNPGDNPYTSNYEPKQFGYMNDLSTLSPDDLGYFEGTVNGLDDRQNSVENAGALLDQYIFNIKEELNKTPKTKIDTIGKKSDDESDELYGQSYEENPYSAELYDKYRSTY